MKVFTMIKLLLNTSKIYIQIDTYNDYTPKFELFYIELGQFHTFFG